MVPMLMRLWQRFRGLAGWAQVTLALAATVVLASPFTSAGPTTTREVLADSVAPVPLSRVPVGVPAGGDDTSVDRVIDGDTIVVAGGRRVRLIGIDTPETVDPSSPVQCFGPEATRYAVALLPVGTPVRLVYDVERLDRYGRTLAYVYKLTDGVFVNLAIARNGFATQLTVPPNVAHAEEFRAAASQARIAELGLWQACQPTTTTAATATLPAVATPTTRAIVAPTTPTTAIPTTAIPTTRATVAPTTPTTVAPATTASGGGCHPSYSGACVPTGFSDVDCAGGNGNGPGYVSTKNFRVVGPDVYGLDADGDGIACESR